MFNTKINLEILIQIILTCSVLSLFYFSYVRTQTKQVLDTQFKTLFNSLLGDDISYLPDKYKQKIYDAVNGMKVPEMKTEQLHSTEKKTIITVIGLMLVSGFIIFQLARKNGVAVTQLVAISSLSLLVISIFQYIILNYFVSGYIMVRPNKLKASILTNIRTYIYGK